jgi:signal transduction histidine kinase/CheY-like chemotaxis protein
METKRVELIDGFVRSQRLELITNVVNNMVTEINMQESAVMENAARDLKLADSILRLYDVNELSDNNHVSEIITVIGELDTYFDIIAYNLETGHAFGKTGSEPIDNIVSRQLFLDYFGNYAASKIYSLGRRYLIGCGISKNAVHIKLVDAMQIYADTRVPMGDVQIRVDALNNYSGQGDFAARIITPFFQRGGETIVNAVNADYFSVFHSIVHNGSAYSEFMSDDRLERLIYAKLYRPYDRVVSSSVSAKDIQQLTNLLAEQFHAQQSNSMFIIAFICLLFTGAALVAFFLLGRLFFHQADYEFKITESANKAKSTFLATMSHEIRTPMNAIIGITQIQLQDENLPDEYAQALQKIHNSGSSLLGIINNVLDLSKIEAGKLELNPVDYDIPSLIHDAVQLNIMRIGSKNIKFKLKVDEHLPAKLCGDEIHLKQILNNLLSNGIKYTNEGYVKLFVSHFDYNGDIMLRFVVEDSGQGIKSEDQKKLFLEYSRFNIETNRSVEGTGLGLNITQRLVEMMDGTIQVESEYGKGSVFIVEVKQKTVECSEIGFELAERLSNFTYISEKQTARHQFTYSLMPYGKVLVVDDFDTNLYVSEGLLAPYKLMVETVDSGFAAIDKIISGRTYDIVFMDQMMPQMDGIETTQKLRLLGYNGTIVALTANALAGNDALFKQYGFDGFISKPIDIRQLNAVLNTFVRNVHPEEAEKWKSEVSPQTRTEIEVDPKLLKMFRRDAEKATVTLRETIQNGDIKLFTTTVHAMKSALANVLEHDASKLAFSLEKAGITGDMGFITANTEKFIETLEALILRFTPQESTSTDQRSTDQGSAVTLDEAEDMAYLIEQLKLVESACTHYDDVSAYAALDRLKEKKWSTETADTLEKIHDALFLNSDFEVATEQSRTFWDRLSRENVF